jgi:hypothetical protein
MEKIGILEEDLSCWKHFKKGQDKTSSYVPVKREYWHDVKLWPGDIDYVDFQLKEDIA